jgi:hypothetical protein
MTDAAEPLPDDTQDPALDEDFAPEFTLDDLNAVFKDADEDVDEPAATADAPASDESEEPPSSSPDEAADEGGVEPQGHAGDDTPLEDPPIPEPTPEPATPAGLVNIDGQMYRAEDVAQLIGYIENLSPEKQALLFGQAEPEPVIDPRTQLPAEDEIVDPRLAEWTDSRFQSVEEKLDAVLAQQQATQAALAAQQQAELNAALDTARRGVAEAHGLSDAEAQRLLEVANNMPAAAAAVQNADLNADPVGAFRGALETAYWLTPEFRDRAIEDQVTTRAAELGVQTALDERRQLNQSLVGSGAAAPRTHAPKPSTPEEHMAAAAALVRESLSNN